MHRARPRISYRARMTSAGTLSPRPVRPRRTIDAQEPRRRPHRRARDRARGLHEQWRGPLESPPRPSRPRSRRPRRRPARPSASPDACAKDSLTLVTPGTFTIGTDNPAYPPYFAREHRRQQDRAVGARRPDQRRPVSRARSASPSPTSSGSASDEVAWIVVPFANAFAPGSEDLRHRPQPGVVQARARRDRRPVEGLLLRQPVAGRDQGQADRRGDLDPAASRTSRSGPRSARPASTRSTRSSSRRPRRRSSTPTTPRSRRSARARSMASWSTFRRPTSSPTSSSRARRSSGSSRAARPSTSARSSAKDSPLTACVDTAIDALVNDGTPRGAGQPVPAVPGRRAGLRAVDADAGSPAHDPRRGPPSPRPAAGASRVAHRDRQHGRRLRRARLGRRQRTWLAEGPGFVPQRRGLRRVAARHRRGVPRQHPAVRRRRGPGPHLRPADRRDAQPARPGVLPDPAHGDRLRRRVPSASRACS